MNCKVAGEELLAFVEGELRPKEREAIESHLADCSACRAEASGLQKTVSLLQDVPDVPLPADVRARMVSRLQEVAQKEDTPQPFWQRWRLWVPALATGALCAFLFVATRQGPIEGPGGGPVGPHGLARVAAVFCDSGEFKVNGKRQEIAEGKKLQVDLREGDEIAVSQGAHPTIVFPGEIAVKTKPGTICKVYDHWLHVKQGDTWLKLSKQQKGFQVTTPSVTVTVLGTTFRVLVERGGNSTVDLREGSVKFETPKGSAIMKPGQVLKTETSGTFELKELEDDVRDEIPFDPSKSPPRLDD